jgi:hypothetical protein
MRTPALVLLLVLSTSACGDAAAGSGGEVAVDTLANGAIRTRNPETGLWGSGKGWRAVESARIGSADAAEPAYMFGEVVDATTDPLGRVWVLDRQARELRVFDAAGRHLRTVGREGAGPGEFRNPIGLSWDAQARLWVSGPLDYGRIPAVKPAFRGVVVDDRGHLWVAATAADADAGRGGPWDVFDPEGRYLGAVAMELDVFPLPRIRGNTVVGVRRDELDVPQVVVYRPEGAGRR